jgi:hypothetical protein
MAELKCQYCDTKLENEEQLKYHYTYAHFVCVLCKTKEKPIYESALILQKHRKAKHPIAFIDEEWEYEY